MPPKVRAKLRGLLVAELRREHRVPGNTFAVAEVVTWPVSALAAAHERVSLTQ